MDTSIPSQAPDPVTRDLVEQLLRTGLVFTDLLASLIEDLPEDAYPGEDNAAVLMEMVSGTCVPVVAAAGEARARETTALIAALHDRVVADLKRALEIARGR